jgi:hypothetical protein
MLKQKYPALSKMLVSEAKYLIVNNLYIHLIFYLALQKNCLFILPKYTVPVCCTTPV